MKRLRISHIIAQPVTVWDDGEELTAGPPLETMRLTPSALAGLAEKLREDIATIERELAAAEPAQERDDNAGVEAVPSDQKAPRKDLA